MSNFFCVWQNLKKCLALTLHMIWKILNHLPLKKGVALLLNKLETQLFKDAVCNFWLKLTYWFWRSRFLNFVNFLSYFIIISSLKKGGGLHLNKLESSSPKNALYQVWLKLANFGCGEEDKNVKSLQTDKQIDRQMNWWRMTGDQKGSLQLSAQVS